MFSKATPTTYTDLCAVYQPKQIDDEIEYQRAVEILGDIIGLELNDDQDQYVEHLASRVEEYEDRVQMERLPDVPAIEVLRSLVEINHLSPNDLGRVLETHVVIAAEVLNGVHPITPEFAERLGREFCLRPSAFLG
jgi:antitoxin component HigA of HigAB toxin-antitoxin module